MASTAVLTKGTEILMGDGADPEVFTKIPNISSLKYKPPEKEKVDVSNLDSEDREHLVGLGAGGQLTFSVHYNQTETMHPLLRKKHNVTDPTNFKLKFPAAQLLEVIMACTVSTDHDMDVGAPQIMNVTLDISGSPAYND